MAGTGGGRLRGKGDRKLSIPLLITLPIITCYAIMTKSAVVIAF